MLVDADPQGTARTWAGIALDYEHAVPDVISMGATMHRRGQLARVASGYDVVAIDTPPRHSPTIKSALVCSDIAVLPCGPYAADAWALAATIDMVADVQGEHDALEARIVITRAVHGTATLKATRPVLEGSGIAVLQTQCGFRMAYAESMAAGLGVNQYAPASAAAAELRSLVDELGGLAHGKANAFANQATNRHRPAGGPASKKVA